MEITEVRVKLMDEPGERLQAFCSITFDDAFVVRDLKIIEGATGPFVAMPSRKLTAHCPQCGCKNHLRAAHCNQCGHRLKEPMTAKDDEGRSKLYADIAHPINSVCREMIQQRVILAFEEERKQSRLPGYRPSYEDFDHHEPVSAPSPVERAPVERAPVERAPVEQAPVEETPAERPPLEPAAVQGAEQPRGPHKAPVHQGQPGSAAQGGFGAGIFD